MFGSNNTIITLNIESDSARLLKVKDKAVESWKAVPLTSDSIQDTVIANVQAVAAALTDLFMVARAAKNEVMVSLTGLRSVYRIVTLPDIKSSKINEAIQWVAMREIPFKLDEVNLLWQQISQANDKERLVFLLATPNNLLDTLKRTLAKAGIKSRGVYLKPLALARFIDQPNAIIVNMEVDSNSMVIMKDSMPQVMHTVIVQQKHQSFADRVQRLAKDLARTVMFYNNAHEGEPIASATPVYATGKVAGDADVVQMLKASIGYTLETPVSCLAYPEGFPVSEYAVNIGLAMKERSIEKQNKALQSSRCPVNINILPDSY